MGFQDLMAHTRKLEMEKIDLQQECEDLRLKVSSLLHVPLFILYEGIQV